MSTKRGMTNSSGGINDAIFASESFVYPESRATNPTKDCFIIFYPSPNQLLEHSGGWMSIKKLFVAMVTTLVSLHSATNH